MQDTKAGGIIALLNFNNTTSDVLQQCNLGNNRLLSYNSIYDVARDFEKARANIVAVISESEVLGASGVSLAEILVKKGMKHIPLFLLSHKIDKNLAQICMEAGVADVFLMPLSLPQIEKRVTFLMKHWKQLQK